MTPGGPMRIYYRMGGQRHTAITISRQMGSGGTYIGYLAAKALDFKYVDREILRLAAAHLKTEPDWLERYDERSSGLLENILRGFAMGTPETACASSLRRPVYDRDLFTAQCAIMNDIADRYDAVFIGRGGFHALGERPGVIRVYIHAPLEFRVERLMKAHQATDRDQAMAEIRDSDRNRARFIRDMAGVDWSDALNYHLCIDTSVVGLAAAADMIMKVARGDTVPR